MNNAKTNPCGGLKCFKVDFVWGMAFFCHQILA